MADKICCPVCGKNFNTTNQFYEHINKGQCAKATNGDAARAKQLKSEVNQLTEVLREKIKEYNCISDDKCNILVWYNSSTTAPNAKPEAPRKKERNFAKTDVPNQQPKTEDLLDLLRKTYNQYLKEMTNTKRIHDYYSKLF